MNSVRSRLARPRLQTAGAALLYLAWAVFLTWPLGIHLGSAMYGDVSGDLAASIAQVREVVSEGRIPFLPGRVEDFNAPFGLEETWVLNVASAPATGLLYALAYPFGSMAGHSLFTLLGYVLSGTAMFLLARRLTGSAGAALVAGFAFAFYPFAVNKGLDHIVFVHGWVLVPVLWRYLELAAAPTLRNGLLAGLATAFMAWFTPYFILFSAVVAAALAIVVLIAARRRAVVPLIASFAVVGTLLAGIAALQLLSAEATAGGTRSHSLDNLVTYSSRAHEFVVPDRNNLLVGDETEPFLTARLHGSNYSESSLYVGLSVIALALLAFVLVARDAWRTKLQEVQSRAVVAALLVAGAGVAFSAPPQLTVGGSLVPAPAWFVFQVTSTWRVYSRFVIVVMAGLALAAAFGAARLLRGRRPPVAAALTALLLVVVAIDLWAKPPDRVTQPIAPEIYRVLADQPEPDAIVAEFPVQPGALPNATARFFQQSHGHPIFNGYAENTDEESRKLELADLADRDTPPGLAAFGVRYVIVNGDYDKGRPGLGLRKIAELGPSLYEVTAAPARAGVDALNGFYVPEGATDEQFRWMVEPRADLLVWDDTCDPCERTLEFGTSSATVPRTLRVLDAGGEELLRQVIEPEAENVRLPLRFSRRTELTLTVDPPPATVPGDPRTLAITMFEPHLETP